MSATVTTRDVIRIAAVAGVSVKEGTVYVWASRGNIVKLRRGYDRASVLRWIAIERDAKQAACRAGGHG